MQEWLLVFHILGAAAWIGGGLYGWYSYAQLARAEGGSGTSLTTLIKTGNRYFGPASGLTLLTGVGLVLNSDAWGWTDAFVLIGLGVFVFSAIWQPLVASKAQAKLLEASAGEGSIGEAMGRFQRVSLVDLGILLVALWAMVMKWGT
jgi:uncharacterized membrane protein